LLAAAIIRSMTEAASTSETSVNLYHTTQRNKPEDSNEQKYGFIFTLKMTDPWFI
jgi:hypothetical protein